MADVDKNIRITTSKNKTTFPNIVFTGSSAGSSVITLEVLDDNTLSFTSNEGQVFSLDSNLSTGTIWSVNDISGFPLLRADVGAASGATIRISEGLGFVGIGQTNVVYKLDVKGQVGFASTNDSTYSILIDNVSAAGSNSLQLRAQNDLRFYNTGNTFYTGFQAGAATANTTYTWPLTSPASGTSVLQSDASGVLSWVVASSGGGAGTVATPGAQYQVASYYAGTGSSVAGSTTFTNNTATGVVNITHTTVSTSSTTGALTVGGGLGVAKAASIGETIYALSTVNSTSLSTGALIVSGGAGFAKTIFVGDNINIFKSGSAGAVRFWNSANTFYTGLQAGTLLANTTYTLPTAFPGSGTSVLASDTSGTMNWVASGGGSGTVTTLTAGNGISFGGSTITTTGTIRRKTSYNLTFMSGYTPTASGVDTVVLRVPDSAADAGANIYNCREVLLRVETPSAGTSTINMQKYAGGGVTAFSTTSTGSTTNILAAALSITGATVYESSSTTFASGHGTVAGGDKLRINFTALNATHGAFNISLLLEEQ